MRLRPHAAPSNGWAERRGCDSLRFALHLPRVRPSEVSGVILSTLNCRRNLSRGQFWRKFACINAQQRRRERWKFKCALLLKASIKIGIGQLSKVGPTGVAEPRKNYLRSTLKLDKQDDSPGRFNQFDQFRDKQWIDTRLRMKSEDE